MFLDIQKAGESLNRLISGELNLSPICLAEITLLKKKTEIFLIY